jgi:hypothetical protein
VDAAIRAARACPTRAIVLSRKAVRVVLGEPPEGVDDPPRAGHAAADGGGAHAAAEDGAHAGGADTGGTHASA